MESLSLLFLSNRYKDLYEYGSRQYSPFYHISCEGEIGLSILNRIYIPMHIIEECMQLACHNILTSIVVYSGKGHDEYLDFKY